MRKFISNLLLLLLLAVANSCIYKELWYGSSETAEVRVDYDWTGSGHENPSTPMGLYLYADYGSSSQFYQTGSSSAVIQVPIGEYGAIAVTQGSDVIRFRGSDDRDTFQAYTGETKSFGPSLLSKSVPRATGAEAESMILEPDFLCRGVAQEISVTLTGEDQRILMQMQEALYICNITIRNVENLRYAQSVSATISGLAASLYLSDGSPSRESVTEPFDCISDGQSVVRGTLRSFGPAAGDVRNCLVLYFILSDGQKIYYTFDVTDAFAKAQAAHSLEVEINIDKIPLPKPIVNGGGYAPSVDEWQIHYVDLNM